ncbi:NAD-dependent epimerase/dehydratase family protein [Streptomyces cyaneochromogenes]|uniref:NAD-dependent epimerase/dehydratase family protein n=1 Tax=Streptomyces cyaneochromogenes TaxID=2496836 RepID=A0A3S9M9S9_9ACTN|nr:NAD(P)H-binding protein [Streptomyces cyaneochromogenes]AZQ35910.1 NAD-dependent epimerase/dehydratase family protein [Streptomyces cyaneochromogenes]
MIVVTGATGNVGRPLVRALVDAGEQVTAVSRRISARDVPAGARHHQSDLTEPERLAPALDGAGALFLLTSGDFMAAGGDLGAVLDVVRDSGVRRVVLLSSQGVGTGDHPPFLEEAVKATGLEWTMLRPGGFHSNTLQWADMVRTRREVAAPFGDVALPTVDPADIAEVAAVALREPGHYGEVYELTGPAPVSPRQQAAAIGEALGEEVRFVELSRAEARERMLGFMPEPVVESTLDMLGAPSAALRRVSPDVEKVLGRPARSFAEWAGRSAGAFK